MAFQEAVEYACPRAVRLPLRNGSQVSIPLRAHTGQQPLLLTRR